METIKIIGITGGIGCGKSKLIELIEERCKVLNINTDKIAKFLMANGNVSYKLIVDHWGESVLTDNEIDSKKLAKIVMSNKDELLRLNSFTHPYVIKEVKDIIKRNSDDYDIAVIESALLLDTPLKDLCTEIWNVSANINTRIERLCKYRGYTKEEAERIINNQKSEEYYMRNSDKTFINNKDNGEDMIPLLTISLHTN